MWEGRSGGYLFEYRRRAFPLLVMQPKSTFCCLLAWKTRIPYIGPSHFMSRAVDCLFIPSTPPSPSTALHRLPLRLAIPPIHLVAHTRPGEYRFRVGEGGGGWGGEEGKSWSGVGANLRVGGKEECRLCSHLVLLHQGTMG